MNLSPAEQILIAEKLAEICGNVPECGEICPAPVYFQDKNDFIKNIGDLSLNTRKKREMSDVAMVVITFSKPPEKPPKHGESWTYHYNFYLFREYDAERLDESENPDDFRKRFLKNYYDFINAILGLHTQIENDLQLDIDSENFLDCFARIEADGDFIEDYGKCRYVPGVSGYAIDLAVEVKVLFREC